MILKKLARIIRYILLRFFYYSMLCSSLRFKHKLKKLNTNKSLHGQFKIKELKMFCYYKTTA